MGKPATSSKRVRLSDYFDNDELRNVEDTYGDGMDDVYNNINWCSLWYTNVEQELVLQHGMDSYIMITWYIGQVRLFSSSTYLI